MIRMAEINRTAQSTKRERHRKQQQTTLTTTVKKHMHAHNILFHTAET